MQRGVRLLGKLDRVVDSIALRVGEEKTREVRRTSRVGAGESSAAQGDAWDAATP